MKRYRGHGVAKSTGLKAKILDHKVTEDQSWNSLEPIQGCRSAKDKNYDSSPVYSTAPDQSSGPGNR